MKKRAAQKATRRSLLASAGVAAGAALFAAAGAVGTQAAMQETATGGTVESPSRHSYVINLRYFALAMEGSNWEKGIGEEIINEFNEVYVNIDVDVLPIESGDVIHKLLAAVAAGEPPDIAYVDAHLPKELGVSEVTQNIFPYIARSGLNVEDYWVGVAVDAVYPYWNVSGSVYRGFWFGMPWAPTITTFFYNQDVFEAASYGPVFVEPNLDPHRAPTNWDEFLHATTLTCKKGNGKIERLGFWHGNNPLAWWLVPYWQQGGQLLSADGLTSTIDNKMLARAFALTLRLLDLQGGLDAINTFKGDEPYQAIFSTGRCAMWTDEIDVIQSSEWAEIFADMNLGVATYPVAPGGSPAAYRGGGAHVVPLDAQDPDGAFAFLEWLFKEDNDLRFNDVRGSLPARRSVANSPEYTQGDPLRLHGVREMERAQGLVSAPGARAIADIHERMAHAIWQREMSISDALADGNAQVQQALDAALKDV